MIRKPWCKDEMEKLEEMCAAGKSDGVIVAMLGRSEVSLRGKRKRECSDNDGHKIFVSSSDELVMPEDVPSVETFFMRFL